MESDHQQEGQRLAQLLARHGVTNKSEFARQHRLKGGPSMLSQHLSGNRPISLDAAVVYCTALRVSLEDVSPSMAEQVRVAAQLLRPALGVHEPELAGPVAAFVPRSAWPHRAITEREWHQLTPDERLEVEGAMLKEYGRVRKERAGQQKRGAA
jgi:hypothetical protein